MPISVSLDSRVAVADEQVSCDLAGDAVVLNVATGQYYELNSVGARVWELLQAGGTVREVRDTLLSEYNVPAEQCTSDILGVLSDLSDADLVRIVD